MPMRYLSFLWLSWEVDRTYYRDALCKKILYIARLLRWLARLSVEVTRLTCICKATKHRTHISETQPIASKLYTASIMHRHAMCPTLTPYPGIVTSIFLANHTSNFHPTSWSVGTLSNLTDHIDITHIPDMFASTSTRFRCKILSASCLGLRWRIE